ncbi:MAG: peptidoglycan-associated lipoprotein Pal [Acidobacteria bacterium]|jgi:peptidoglycan-associated lipoprotein|nr:peptidoglycan-associated lipoprotein Pal [Acidobacteriota bacterium]
MKKWMLLVVAVSLVLMFSACGKKAAQVAPVQEPVVEKVEEPVAQVEKPVLSEEELFQQKSLEELNRDQILKRINFDFDKYEIRDDMKAILQANANWLLKFPSVEVLIEGHCDERGTIEYNIALGEKRAEAARNYLASLGLNAAKVKIISYGKSKPLIPGVDEASYFQNRRAEFVITKK